MIKKRKKKYKKSIEKSLKYHVELTMHREFYRRKGESRTERKYIANYFVSLFSRRRKSEKWEEKKINPTKWMQSRKPCESIYV